MSIQSVWLNLESQSIEKTVDFYTKLGATLFFPQGEKGAMVSVTLEKGSQILYIESSLFAKMAPFNVGQNEVLISLDVTSREELDAFMKKVQLAGATITSFPQEMMGIDGASFQDVDGHHFNVIVMPN